MSLDGDTQILSLCGWVNYFASGDEPQTTFVSIQTNVNTLLTPMYYWKSLKLLNTNLKHTSTLKDFKVKKNCHDVKNYKWKDFQVMHHISD